MLELGADFNQGRYVDDDLLAAHLAARGDTMLCEIVFLLNSPLIETNNITQVGSSAAKPVVQMQPGAVSGALWNEMNDLKKQSNRQFGRRTAGKCRNRFDSGELRRCSA